MRATCINIYVCYRSGLVRSTDQESIAIEKMVVIHSSHEEGPCLACRAWSHQEAPRLIRRQGEQGESTDVNFYCRFLREGMGQGRVSRFRIG